MRVLTVGNLFPPHHHGGYELRWAADVDALRARGYEIRVLTSDYRNPAVTAADGTDVHRELRWYRDGLRATVLPLRERVRMERHNAAVLRRHLRDLRPDIVCWWGMGGMSLSLIEQVRREELAAVGVVGDDWMVYGPGVDNWTRFFIGRPAFVARAAQAAIGIPARIDLSGAATWVFNSRFSARRVREAGIRLERCEVVHPAPDPRFGAAIAGERPWRWRLLYVGRVERRKGVDVAIRALARLPEEAELLIAGSAAGEDAYVAELEAMRDRLGLEGRVRLSGSQSVDELVALHRDADALLFPVRWDEPFGRVPVEAMAAQTPVVATATGGAAEYLADERNALVVARDSEQAIADAVMRLSADRALRRRVVGGGAQTAERMAYDHYLDRMEGILVSKAARRSPR